VHGTQFVETYLVNIYPPNSVVFSGLRVSKGKLSGADILIGMDIISRGDFAVTHKGGDTKFTFRIPSQADIDFAKETRAKNAMAARIVKSRGLGVQKRTRNKSKKKRRRHKM